MDDPIAIETLPSATLGEGPWWDVATQRLYWVDIPGHRIHRFDPGSGQCETHEVGTFVSFAIADRRGDLVVGLRDGIYRTAFGSAQRAVLCRPDMHPDNRFNDGLCDRQGRLWAGTMHIAARPDRAPTGALYRHGDAGLEVVEPDVGISNGLGWSPDGSKMYFAETFEGIVWVYDYDPVTGLASDRRVFATIAPVDGVPDGLTVDSRGRVLVAVWRGSRINIYDPSGVIVDVVHLPVPCPTSCAFGGADLRSLYITTARSDGTGEPSSAPHAGHLFSCRMDVAGLAEARFA